eukprot:5642735-Lingulodinium_polyedra.AAC.1
MEQFQGVTTELHAIGFEWKPGSLELMAANPNDRQRSYTVMTAMGEFEIPKVERVRILGTEVPSDGG